MHRNTFTYMPYLANKHKYIRTHMHTKKIIVTLAYSPTNNKYTYRWIQTYVWSDHTYRKKHIISKHITRNTYKQFHVCMWVYAWVCVCVCVCVCEGVSFISVYFSLCVFLFYCVYVCVCVFLCLFYIYIYIYNYVDINVLLCVI